MLPLYAAWFKMLVTTGENSEKVKSAASESKPNAQHVYTRGDKQQLSTLLRRRSKLSPRQSPALSCTTTEQVQVFIELAAVASVESWVSRALEYRGKCTHGRACRAGSAHFKRQRAAFCSRLRHARGLRSDSPQRAKVSCPPGYVNARSRINKTAWLKSSCTNNEPPRAPTSRCYPYSQRRRTHEGQRSPRKTTTDCAHERAQALTSTHGSRK